MRTTCLAAWSWPHRKDQGSADWRAALQREVRQARSLGLSREEIVALVAQRLYRQDMQEFGWVLDIGLLSWETYLGDAELMVDWLLQPESLGAPPLEVDRRSA